MRMIAKHSPIRPTRIFYSKKNDAVFFMESGLEREFALRCEFDPRVLSYRCQPEPIYYTPPGESKSRRYTPDTLLEHVDLGSVAIEVKPASYAAKPELQEKHSLLKDLYAEIEIGFLVVTEREIRDQHLTSNFSSLYRFLRFDIDKNELKALKQHFPNGMFRADVIELLDTHPSWLSLAHQALAHGFLIADLRQEISPETYMGWTA